LVFEARGVPHGLRRTRGDALLADFGLAAVERSRAETLSGGERRRLEIARAIAAEPTFLLLDEPFTGVDPIAVTDVRAILIALAEKRRLGVLITDHNAREVLELCDRVYVIHEGTLLAEGTPQAVAANEAVVRVYLGDRFTFDSLTMAGKNDEACRERSGCKAPRSEHPRRTLAYVEGASNEGNAADGPLSASERRINGD
jgi:ABC-type lipopolysaccharide export system ATPase subunit